MSSFLVRWVHDLHHPESDPAGSSEIQPLEDVLNGRAIELWSNASGERFWLVADEEDVVRLGEPRGTVYTASEARRVIQIGDPTVVAEVHRCKREFDGKIRNNALNVASTKRPMSAAPAKGAAYIGRLIPPTLRRGQPPDLAPEETTR